jgi:hypothetical protein
MPGTHSISDRIISYGLDFFDRTIEICLNSQKYESQETQLTQGNFFQHSFFWSMYPDG